MNNLREKQKTDVYHFIFKSLMDRINLVAGYFSIWKPKESHNCCCCCCSCLFEREPTLPDGDWTTKRRRPDTSLQIESCLAFLKSNGRVEKVDVSETWQCPTAIPFASPSKSQMEIRFDDNDVGAERHPTTTVTKRQRKREEREKKKDVSKTDTQDARPGPARLRRSRDCTVEIRRPSQHTYCIQCFKRQSGKRGKDSRAEQNASRNPFIGNVIFNSCPTLLPPPAADAASSYSYSASLASRNERRRRPPL